MYVSWESAYLNVLMYAALTEWADVEGNVLGNAAKRAVYANKAAQLKAKFSQNVANGGFWNPARGAFAYWRDQDNSIHGDALQTQINLWAIQYGLTDLSRSKQILLIVENAMKKNGLALLPLNFIHYGSDSRCDGVVPDRRRKRIDLSANGGALYGGGGENRGARPVARVFEPSRQSL